MVGSRNIVLKAFVSILIMVGAIMAAFTGYSSEKKQLTLTKKQYQQFDLTISLIENNLEDEDGLDEKGKSTVIFDSSARNIFFLFKSISYTSTSIEITERGAFLLFRFLRI